MEEPCPRNPSPQPRRYMIAWNDTPGIDGDYILVIHPTQIFLRSAHNNPNPDYVYWVAPLPTEQYSMLVRYLDKYDGKLFEDHQKLGYWKWNGYKCDTLSGARVSPWYTKFPEDKQDEWEKETMKAANYNLRRILKELNRGLSTMDTKLPSEAAINVYPDITRIKDRY